LQYTIAHPDRVDNLILSNSAAASSEGYALFGQEYIRRMSPYQEELEKIQSSQGFRDGDACVMEQFYRLIFRQYCYIPEKADLLSLGMTSIASLNGAKVSEIIRENVLDKPFNLNQGLKALKVSTLILHGDADPIPPITAKNTHENIPGSKYILMKNCGHFPYVEDPATYFKYISEFLNTD
jgi:pimeloyl-ACP methyl ester carboxylesterase